MKIPKLALFIVLASLTLFYIILTWPGLDSDLTAYVRGDYETAATQFREAAEQGDAKAQHYLALLYDGGKGVPQDDAEAIKWYGKAAEQGYADAQYNLSMVYYFGKGVPQDYVAAYKWLMLAAGQGEKHASDAMTAMAEKMSGEQITAAQEAARAWSEKHAR